VSVTEDRYLFPKNMSGPPASLCVLSFNSLTARPKNW
jgi:hypothetical protein